jgi:hypothetical protein
VSEPLLIDPGDNVIVTIDWSAELGTGVTLSSVTHTVPSPLSKNAESTDVANNRSSVKLSGVVHGGLYAMEGQATLSNGETVNRQVMLRGWNS